MTDIIKGRLTVIGCGGAGTNIVSQLEKHRDKSNPGFATIEPVYVDTSRSNLLDKNLPEEAVYHFSGLDGSGQLRREHASTIKDSVKQILLTHKPGDFAIVVHSGSGGSGSVIAPLIAAELLARGVPTIVIMVGDASTRLYAENTLNTIKSYEAIAKSAGKPVVLAYLQNTAETPRAVVDADVEKLIESLAALMSRENTELDTADIYNALDFQKVTHFKDPIVATLQLLTGSDRMDNLDVVISVITLAKKGADTTLAIIPEVRYQGVLPDNIDSNLADHSPLHFITTDGLLQRAAGEIQNVLDQLSDSRAARTARKSVSGSGDRVDNDTGLVGL